MDESDLVGVEISESATSAGRTRSVPVLMRALTILELLANSSNGSTLPEVSSDEVRCPLIWTNPEVGKSIAPARFSSVDLPQPLRPTRETTVAPCASLPALRGTPVCSKCLT